jgi:proton glutamate symport protein
MLPAIIISSIGRITTSSSSHRFVIKIFAGLILTFVLLSFTGMVSAYLVSPITAPDNDTRKSMGQLIMKSQHKDIIGGGDALKPYYFIKQIPSDFKKKEDSLGMEQIIVDFIPDNIFHSLANNETVKILLFSIIFGIILKYMSAQASASIINMLDNVFEVFNELLMFLLYFMPLCIIAIMAEQAKGLDFKILKPLINLGLLITLVMIIVFVMCLILIKVASKKPLPTILRVLKEPMFLSFIAENTLIAIPSLTKGMIDDLGLCRERVNFTVPLWLSFESHTGIMFMACISVFALQLYNVPVTLGILVLILLISIVAGLSTMAVPSPIWVSQIAIVLIPLNLPTGPIIFALFLLEPFFGSLLNLLNAVISCAAASLLSRNTTASGVL